MSDNDNIRQSSGSTTCTTDTVTSMAGVGTAESAELVCGCPEPGPEKIEVEQVLGAKMAQRVVEFDMIVPAQKPPIEQVIDVYVKDVECDSIDVIPDKVIIRGHLEVKVMYVADLPNQPVHAFEKQHIRFTRDIEIDGAEPGMKATADIQVEFVDYDFECFDHDHDHDQRKVHVTIVLRFWARVVTTTEMDVYALTPVDQIGQPIEKTTSASTFNSDSVSAASTGGGKIEAFGVENVLVTGPEVMPMVPTAGTQAVVSGTATVTGSSVNVRTGPGTNFPVVTKVNKGETVTLRDQAFGWNRVILSDGTTTGWIASWLLSSGGAPTNAKG
ncbi:SPOCS domain-containing protein [Anaerosporomusa subterranea]|nr:SPOCS domain-containing protein [Anaerosporomusa subterranea]